MLNMESDKAAPYKLDDSYDLDKEIVLEDYEGTKYVVVNLDLSAVEPLTLFRDTLKPLGSEPAETKNENILSVRNESIGISEDQGNGKLYNSINRKTIKSDKSSQNSKEKVMNKKHKELRRKDILSYNELFDIVIVLFILMLISS